MNTTTATAVVSRLCALLGPGLAPDRIDEERRTSWATHLAAIDALVDFEDIDTDLEESIVYLAHIAGSGDWRQGFPKPVHLTELIRQSRTARTRAAAVARARAAIAASPVPPYADPPRRTRMSPTSTTERQS